MRGRWTRGVVAAVAAAAVLLGASACGAVTSGEDEPTPGNPVKLYGSDGNMSNSLGDAFKDAPGVLNGMKGTLPLNPLTEDFKRRLKAVDPNLADFNYAGETYDAVVIAALAAEVARTVDPPAIARQIVGVTTGDMTCDSPAACLAVARSGRDFKYRGVSMRRSGLTEIGEPSSASYGVLNFGRNNRIDDAKTEYVGAGDEKTENKKAAPSVSTPRNGRTPTPLKIGSLLGKTGGLAFAGPPLFAAIKLAIKDINEAGGVLGAQVIYEEGDDGTSPDVAAATVDRHIASGVHVIIGAGASGVSKAVLPKVVAANRVMISPTATSDELTKLDDKGFFFRTSPPDILQAKAIADIIMRDGHQRVAIVARDDSYGKGLAEAVQADLTVAGIKPKDLKVIMYRVKDAYDPKIDTDGIFTPIASELKKFDSTAVLVIGYDESSFVIKALVGQGVQVSA